MLKLMRHPLFAILFAIGAAVFSLSLYSSQRSHSLSAETVNQLESEVANIAHQNEALETQLEQAKSPLAQEKIIRNELLLQKPGEYVIQIVEPEQPVASPAAKTAPPTPWEEWRALLL